MKNGSFDVIVVGGGAIGLACAHAIARAAAGDSGRAAAGPALVAVIDAGELGREASWAGGGILSPVHPWAYPPALTELVARSTALYPGLARELLELSGVSIELRTSGLLRLALDEEDEADLIRAERFRAARALPSERLSAAEVARRAPAASSRARAALLEPEVAQVRSPRLLRALLRACEALGVALLPHEPVLDLLRSGERVTGVRTASRELHAREVVLAAGAWSGELCRRATGLALPVAPVRGQMLLLETAPGEALRGPPLEPMILGAGGRYLIPRGDGRVLVGSTLEHVGFDKRTTAAGIAALLDAALRLAPGLGGARLAGSWAGLRPGTPDRLPYIGRTRGVEGLILATGHYRNGLVLAPVTGELVRDLALGRAPTLDPAPFSADRAPGEPARD